MSINQVSLECILVWSQLSLTHLERYSRLLLHRPRRGFRGMFSPCLSVCISVCLCICVSGQYFSMFFLSAIRRDIDLKFIQDTNRVVLNSLQIHWPSKVKVTWTVHCFLKVQSYHKNWAIETFHRHLLGYSIRWNNKNLSEQRNDVIKIRQYLTLNM